MSAKGHHTSAPLLLSGSGRICGSVTIWRYKQPLQPDSLLSAFMFWTMKRQPSILLAVPRDGGYTELWQTSEGLWAVIKELC